MPPNTNNRNKKAKSKQARSPSRASSSSNSNNNSNNNSSNGNSTSNGNVNINKTRKRQNTNSNYSGSRANHHSEHSRKSNSSNNSTLPSNITSSPIIQGGFAGSFFRSTLPNLSLIQLIGNNSPQQSDNLKRISHFLTRHKAMMTLAECNHDTTTTPPPPNTALNTTPHSQIIYLEAMTEFASSQMERQAAGLSGHSNKALDCDQATEITSRNRLALETSLAYANSLQHQDMRRTAKDNIPQYFNLEMLQEWHAILISGGGTLRNIRVKCGTTIFGEAARVPLELSSFFEGFCGLADNDVLQKEESSAGLILASTVLYGLADIHPFKDGNGRLSRIASNYILKLFGEVPFCVNFHATAAQRREYIHAMEETRGNIQTRLNNGVPSPSPKGILEPILNLLASRLVTAMDEIEHLIKQKTYKIANENAARQVRRAREEASKGSCVICLEPNPNIATLCCGSAVHLNCFAEWLSSKQTCVVCRGEMPLLKRQKRESEDDASENDSSDEEWINNNDTTGSYTISNDTTRVLGYPPSLSHSYSGGVMVDEDEWAVYEEYDITSSNTTNVWDHLVDNMADTVTTTSSTGTVEQETLPQPPRQQGQGMDCMHNECRNRAALNCSNSLCGKCCVIYGAFPCDRHNIGNRT